MKSTQDVVACVVDYGTFLSVAEKLAETYAKVYYYSPYEKEYQDVRDCVIGTGLERVERLDDFYSRIDEVDLFVFPDISFGGLQRYLRSLGKHVWGHMGASELELSRSLFYRTLEDVGLPVVPYTVVNGLSALQQLLRGVKNKWVKTSRYRGNQETWKWIDYQTSKDVLDSLAVIFGGAASLVEFVVQDDIESDIELGYDGWVIDGAYPEASFQGYEKKNELYLGHVLANDKLPEPVRIVNQKMAPVLMSYGYRGWWATEIRVKGDTPYFIDPTPRCPGQTGEHQQESITNFADIIWKGANGILERPHFNYDYAAEATLHYESNIKDPTVVDPWKSLRVPASIARWIKPYHYFRGDGVYHFGGRNTDEVGVVLGLAQSKEGAKKHLEKNLEALKKVAPVDAETDGFSDLEESISEAEKKGYSF